MARKKPTPDYDPLSGLPAPEVPDMLGVAADWNGEARPKSEGLKAVQVGGSHGVPGIKHWFGRLYEEFLPQLADDKGRRAYVEMAWNEPAIFSFRYAIEMLVRQVKFHVTPFDESPEAEEIANFVDSCYHDLESPLQGVVADAFTMIIYGWAVQEMTFKVRRGQKAEVGQKSRHNDGKIAWSHMAPRHQETIWRWELDTQGRVLGVVQWAPPAWQFSRIPAEVILHYKTHEWHASPEGVSMLRGAVIPFEFKKGIQTMEAIGIERDACGIPVVGMPAERMRLALEAGADGLEARKEKESLEKLARDIKVDQQQGVVFPIAYDEAGRELYTLKLMASAGSKTIDPDVAIRRYKEEMLSAVIADFLAFGHETTGTQALGASRAEMFMTAVNTLIDCFCGPQNRVAIPLLCELNGFDGLYPTLTHDSLKEVNLAALGTFLQVLGGVGVDLTDKPTEDHLRRTAGLPVPEVDSER
jgi:hypothetical protein